MINASMLTQTPVDKLLEGMLSSLQRTSEELDDSVRRREMLLRQSREILAAASKALVAIQGGRFDEARRILDGGRGLLEELRKESKGDLARYLTAPGAELVEAEVVWSVAQGLPVASREELGVDGATYLLGLLDAIGEIKRLVVDSVRLGDVKRAESLFELMENIYMHLTPFAVYDHVVTGVRRKLDVDRLLVESTRAMVAEELRRSALLKALDQLGVDRKRQS